MFKKLWKEFLIVFLLTILLSVLADFIPFETTRETLFSPVTYAIAIAALMLPPLVPAVIGGYMVSKKSYLKSHSILVPGTAVAAAGIFFILISVGQLYMLSEAGWQAEFSKANEQTEELGLGFLSEMTLQEFKDFTLNAIIFALPLVAVLNLAFGVIGGLIGSYLYSRKKG